MKLWQKIFICTFLLFEIVFNVAIIYLIEQNFVIEQKREIERGLAEHFVIYSGLKTNGVFYKDKFGYSNDTITEFLKTALKDYATYFEKDKVFVELLNEKNEVVYNGFNSIINEKREELSSSLSEKRKYIIRDIKNRNYLFITNRILFDNKSYKLTYIRDISEVYANKKMNYNIFIKMNLSVIVFFAIMLYLLLWYLTYPIRYLTQSAQNIAGGDYSTRADIESKDEIGILAHTFNKMAESIESNAIEMKQTAETKEQFIQSLTHELKTPLTSIIGYADFLQTTKYDEEKFYKALNYIYTEGKRLERLSLKLMDLVLLDKKEIEMKNIDITFLCYEIHEIMKPKLENKNIDLILEIHPCKVMVEPDLFKVLLTNLIDNAIKASNNEKCIYLRIYPKSEHNLVLEVEDQGKGIPQKDINRVLEPFFTVDKSRSKSHQGAGLGLAICAKIVMVHHGTITINSKINEGTIVQITFLKIYN